MAARKGLCFTDSAGVEYLLNTLSKDALADLVIVLVRKQRGMPLEGRALAQAIEREADPVLTAREDHRMNVDGYDRMLDRYRAAVARRGESTTVVDIALNAWREG